MKCGLPLQMHTQSKAKKLGLDEADVKLPVAVGMAASSMRERDWANVVTAHEGDTTAYTWMLSKYRRVKPSLVHVDACTLHCVHQLLTNC